MLPAVVKNKIEQIWLDVIAGGVSQPTEVIEQLTYLMFAKQLDEHEADIETAELQILKLPNCFQGNHRNIFLGILKKNRHCGGEILKGWKLENFTNILLNMSLFF